MMKIKQAQLEDLENLSGLFDRYRTFYGQPKDIEVARNFMRKRLTNRDSVIFLAMEQDEPLGFVQLYPSFTSIGVKEIWILNDLFVDQNHRKKGVARLLINHVLVYARTTNRKKVTLSTAHTNQEAQRLYEALEFNRAPFYIYEKWTT